MFDLFAELRIIGRLALAQSIDQYIYVFVICFLSVAIVTRKIRFFERFYFSVEDKIIGLLKNRDLFFVADALREEVWINLLRLITGYIFVERSFWILYFELGTGGPLVRPLATSLDLILSICLMFGFLTPIALSILFFFHTYVHDILLGTYTLGSCVAQILIMIFFFMPAGRFLSVDGLIMSSRSLGAGFLIKLYGFVGIPTGNRIAILKFCAFISYGLLCLFSVYGHIKDPYWWNGTANVFILTSNWLTGPYQFFRDIFSAYGEVAIVASMIALYIMMLWELVIIPFILLKGAPRYFVIGWGLAFFFVSRFVLQLSWLPHFQVVLFAILFWPGLFLNRSGRDSLKLFYDDHCNLCDRVVRFITMIDWFSVVQLRPMSQSDEEIKASGLTKEAVFNDLHGYDSATGRIYAGYDLYLQLAARIFVLVPLFPLLLVWKILRIGPPVYSYIATRRRRIFGVCQRSTIDVKAAHAREAAVSVVSQVSSFFIAYLLTYVIFMSVYLIKLPYFSDIPGWSRVQQAFNFVSTTPPSLNGQINLIVFTPQVLTMGSHYFTITAVFAGGTERLLPYVGPKGDRLGLVLKSDRLYFGHALVWRRLMYGQDGVSICYEAARDSRLLYVLFDIANRYWHETPDSLRVDYYHQDIPEPQKVAEYEYKLPPTKHVCSMAAKRQDPWVIEPSPTAPR